MKLNVLLFTQTMHSLLKSSLTLQSALEICAEILAGKKDKELVTSILKGVRVGKKLADVMAQQHKLFSQMYISLISIGEESGTLQNVFGRLAEYMEEKKNLKQKVIQTLAYPAIVMATALILIFLLVFFVMPRFEEIFLAFTESSQEVSLQLMRMKYQLVIAFIFLNVFIILLLIFVFAHKVSNKAALILDAIVVKIPLVGKAIITMQMYDFSFAMKLLSRTHFPLVPSLMQARTVISNKKISSSVFSAAKAITNGISVGKAFANESVFPKYLTVWIKIAEQNGNTAEAFSQVCDYYSSENENILAGINAFIEPIFILLTGGIIVSLLFQFIIPIFNLMGTL